MKKNEMEVGICPDCGRENMEIIASGMYAGTCKMCRQRKQNAKARRKEYIPFIQLPEKEKQKINNMILGQERTNIEKGVKLPKEIALPEIPKTIPVIENYYQVKAENNTAIAHIVEKPVPQKVSNPFSDKESFINILKECGCDTPEEILKTVLDILIDTDKLKNVFMNITKTDNQQAILDLEQSLTIVENKLQHDWECNNFQEEYDIKFKEFLTWRRILKGAISFWKSLQEANIFNNIQKTWDIYIQDNK